MSLGSSGTAAGGRHATYQVPGLQAEFDHGLGLPTLSIFNGKGTVQVYGTWLPTPSPAGLAMAAVTLVLRSSANQPTNQPTSQTSH